MLRDVTKGMKNVVIDDFNGLVVEYVKARGSRVMIRGLRMLTDFEYEFQLVGMNRVLAPNIETVFLAPAEHLSYISSTLVREIASYGGDISKFVNPIVAKAMLEDREREGL